MHAHSSIATTIVMASLFAGFLAEANAQSTPVETEPTLQVSDFKDLPPLSGSGYTIEKSVPVSGYQGQFSVKTDLGNFVADGTDQLRQRIAEIGPARELEKMSSSDVFVKAFAQSTARGAKAVGKAVTQPIDTLKGAPAGVGRFFGSIAKTVTDGGGDVSEASGMGDARRKIAHQVGVDPYTSNPIVSDRLGDLSKAAFAGGVSLDVAFTVATGGVAAAVSFTKTVSELAWELPPEDIRARNDKDLAALGIGKPTRDALLRGRTYTPTLALAFVDAMKALGVKQGADEFTKLAAGAKTETEARFYIDQLRMANVYTKQSRISALGTSGKIGTMIAGSDVFVPVPVDYLTWTAGVKSAVQGGKFGTGARTAWFTGQLSPAARKGLKDAGWNVREQAPRS